MERPALQRLLRDVESGRIDVIVVYKVDRLQPLAHRLRKNCRSIRKEQSLVRQHNSTIQHHDLDGPADAQHPAVSFAQFEREVIGERIRDKFAASRRKGMWMGGTPPLGYDVATASWW